MIRSDIFQPDKQQSHPMLTCERLTELLRFIHPCIDLDRPSLFIARWRARGGSCDLR